MFIQTLFGLLIGFVIAYLIAYIICFEKIKHTQREFWAEIGSPSMWSPFDQIGTFGRIIFGVGLPVAVASACKKQIIAVRILLAISLTLFIAINAAVMVVKQ